MLHSPSIWIAYNRFCYNLTFHLSPDILILDNISGTSPKSPPVITRLSGGQAAMIAPIVVITVSFCGQCWYELPSLPYTDVHYHQFIIDSFLFSRLVIANLPEEQPRVLLFAWNYIHEHIHGLCLQVRILKTYKSFLFLVSSTSEHTFPVASVSFIYFCLVEAL